jgi:hypothetical protein
VCFVREFVPQWSVATIARVLYNEPYRSARMTMRVEESRLSPAESQKNEPSPAGGKLAVTMGETITAEYTVKWGGRVHALRAVGDRPAERPGPESVEHWFKEHSWGFGTSRRGKLIRYEVNHPEWDVYPVQDFSFDIDWATLYGPEWARMTSAQPASVVFAVGSEISVYPKG